MATLVPNTQQEVDEVRARNRVHLAAQQRATTAIPPIAISQEYALDPAKLPDSQPPSPLPPIPKAKPHNFKIGQYFVVNKKFDFFFGQFELRISQDINVFIYDFFGGQRLNTSGLP